MNRSAVQAWLDRYVEAWKSYDPAAIEALFAPDATYRYHPYDTDAPSRAATRSSRNWLENRDVAGTYDGHYEPYAVEGDRAVAIGDEPLLDGRVEGDARPGLRQRLPARVRRRRPLHVRSPSTS